jgi:hypothetical protein
LLDIKRSGSVGTGQSVTIADISPSTGLSWTDELEIQLIAPYSVSHTSRVFSEASTVIVAVTVTRLASSVQNFSFYPLIYYCYRDPGAPEKYLFPIFNYAHESGFYAASGALQTHFLFQGRPLVSRADTYWFGEWHDRNPHHLPLPGRMTKSLLDNRSHFPLLYEEAPSHSLQCQT